MAIFSFGAVSSGFLNVNIFVSNVCRLCTFLCFSLNFGGFPIFQFVITFLVIFDLFEGEFLDYFFLFWLFFLFFFFLSWLFVFTHYSILYKTTIIIINFTDDAKYIPAMHDSTIVFHVVPATYRTRPNFLLASILLF